MGLRRALVTAAAAALAAAPRVGRRAVAVAAAVLLAATATALGPPPAADTKCPVCGMFVAKYPDWVAGVSFRDGTTAHFDGAKDLFKYLLHPERYGAAGRGAAERIYVTDYYAVTPVDARAAFFVIGSDVFGPMGTELVPFERRADAEEFVKDHHGKAILGFQDVGDATLRVLQAPE